MNGAFYIGATGLEAQERALGVIANNITNMNTPGFKRSSVSFSELVASGSAAETALLRSADAGLQMGGVRMDSGAGAIVPGELRPTGSPFDLAIDGQGFIELLGPAGEVRLWRGGTLKVNQDGYLAAATGLLLKGMISIPDGATDLAIGRDGTVTVTVPGEDGAREIGKIDLVTVRDTVALTRAENGVYVAQDEADMHAAVVGEDGAGTFAQGAAESSNVQLSDEMVSMLLMQRAYGASAQVVQAGDQLMAIANNLRR